jgi:hypothetical protein
MGQDISGWYFFAARITLLQGLSSGFRIEEEV